MAEEESGGTRITGGNFNAKAMAFGKDSVITIGQPSAIKKKPVTKVLLAFANPVDGVWLRLGEGEHFIREAWGLGDVQDGIEMKALHATSGNDLRRALQGETHIVHLAGQGMLEGTVLIDGNGLSRLITLEAMEVLFEGRGEEKVQCVILNQRYATSLAQVLVRYIPYVIVIDAKLDDEVAMEFSRGFYDAISVGRDIVNAYNEGRRAVFMNCPGVAFSGLLMQSGS